MPRPSFIDTHCHLEMDQFAADRDEVISRAEQEGIEAMITIASDPGSNEQALRIVEQHPSVYASVGIHPHDARLFDQTMEGKIRAWAQHAGVVALGETGLDYHYDHSPRDMQREVFRKHLALAKELDLPAIIHSREAKEDTLDILSESNISRGVLHCFSGDQEMAERAMMMGLSISFAGPVTFKNADRLREIARRIPDDYLLIETDAPHLAPEPHRGKRNEPSYVIQTAGAIAGIRGITLEDVARITTLNAKRLFRIGQTKTVGEIVYRIRDSLYLNITNRCTNVCSFCVRLKQDFVKGHNLRLSHEPSEEELIHAIGDPKKYREIVFCGYGEPMLRLDTVKQVASWVKEHGGSVRINTNGHGNLIAGRNVLPELQGIVDEISISIDAQNEDIYNSLCRPTYQHAFPAVIDFAQEAKKHVPRVTLTVVAVKGVDIGKTKKIAERIGADFRVRRLNDVG